MRLANLPNARGLRVFSTAIIIVVGIIVFAFIGGALFRTIVGGANAPEVPRVNEL